MPVNEDSLPYLNEHKFYLKPVDYSKQCDGKDIHASNTQVILPPIRRKFQTNFFQGTQNNF